MGPLSLLMPGCTRILLAWKWWMISLVKRAGYWWGSYRTDHALSSIRVETSGVSWGRWVVFLSGWVGSGDSLLDLVVNLAIMIEMK